MDDIRTWTEMLSHKNTTYPQSDAHSQDTHILSHSLLESEPDCKGRAFPSLSSAVSLAPRTLPATWGC